jgi:hypothetical protein
MNKRSMYKCNDCVAKCAHFIQNLKKTQNPIMLLSKECPIMLAFN